MKKVVVYGGTRNLYSTMVVAVRSLFAHNDVDIVYFLTEDDDFPYKLPDNVRVINVSDQTYFPENGANYANHWHWMSLMRIALPKMLKYSRVVWLDCDTIVEGDISDLFTTDMKGYYFAGVKEITLSKIKPYINAGVLVMNLSEIRKDKQDDRMIDYLNTVKLKFPDQDTINDLSQGRIKFLDSKYNVFKETAPTNNPVIYHFAGETYYNNKPIFGKYAGWELK